MPLMRIPYTDPLPPPRIIPASASTYEGAVAALTEFLTSPSPLGRKNHARPASLQERGQYNLPARSDSTNRPAAAGRRPTHALGHGHDGGCIKFTEAQGQTVLLTGAGLSVASGLADYRGTSGTYTLNKTFRPIYYHEFIAQHDARKRYWARSFLGWANMHRARPNSAHYAIRDLGALGRVRSVVTQNVDSFHRIAHPNLPTVELHGYLRTLTCLSCRREYSRDLFQKQLAALNPAWAVFLEEMLAKDTLTTEHPEERSKRGLRANPDGDVDVPDAPYSTFRYPACPRCLEDKTRKVELDPDGAWLPSSRDGVLKPSVIMFGESISGVVKKAAEEAIDSASRLLVVGSSLATYSAWRLVKRAKENGMLIGVLNLGGVRGEDGFFAHIDERNPGSQAFRASEYADKVLPEVVGTIKELDSISAHRESPATRTSGRFGQAK